MQRPPFARIQEITQTMRDRGIHLPLTDTDKPEPPRIEPPKLKAELKAEPKIELKAELPKVELPKVELKAEPPKVELKAEPPKEMEPKAEGEPKVEEPKVEDLPSEPTRPRRGRNQG